MMDGWDWIWGMLMMLVFWGGLAAVIVFAVKAFSGPARRGSGEAQTPDARTMLENRYARGEISQEEFEERMRILGSHGE